MPALSSEGYVGVDVHRGARVASLAHGGQILVSPATAALLDGETLLDLGRHRLKDFDGATRLYQLGSEQFPPLRTPGSVELPSPPTRFLGRERELFEAVSVFYERDPRVLTILGPGGTGKTRFALELARLLADEADSGTVFVALAPLRDASLVVPAIAERLGAAQADMHSIATRVGDRRTHLLVDNLEHLLPLSARLLAELIAAAPSLRMIATSREPLRIQGEAEFDLPPLRLDEAVALFLERAGAVAPDVQADDAVERLCRRLDRLPLALELAAARTKVLPPERLLARLGGALDLLQGTRDAEDRHATLRATIQWSYDLLDDDERQLFRRLAIFRNGCTLESAEAVCDAQLETLASLVDKSLVRRRPGVDAADRFWLLETIREFGIERLEENYQREPIARRHAERMLDIARAARLGEGQDAPFDVGAALAERDDLRAALDWAADSDAELGLELMVALENMWVASSPDEGLHRIEQLLDRASSVQPALRAAALRVEGGSADLAGRRDLAERVWRESLELYRSIDDDFGIAAVESRLAVVAWRRGDWDEFRALTENSLARSRGRFEMVEIPGHWALGQLRLQDGDLAGAIELTSRSAAMAREIGWTWWESGQLHELLALALRDRDFDEADRHGRAALVIEREQENRLWAVYTLAGLAQVALVRGEIERAGRLWGAADREGQHFPSWEHEQAMRAGALIEEGSAAFVSARADGAELDLWDAVAIALGEDEAAQTVP